MKKMISNLQNHKKEILIGGFCLIAGIGLCKLSNQKPTYLNITMGVRNNTDASSDLYISQAFPKGREITLNQFTNRIREIYGKDCVVKNVSVNGFNYKGGK